MFKFVASSGSAFELAIHSSFRILEFQFYGIYNGNTILHNLWFFSIYTKI